MASKGKQSSNKLQSDVYEANIGNMVVIVLFDSQRIKGTIVDYDKYSILVRTAKKTSLIYKHSIMYIDEIENEPGELLDMA